MYLKMNASATVLCIASALNKHTFFSYTEHLPTPQINGRLLEAAYEILHFSLLIKCNSLSDGEQTLIRDIVCSKVMKMLRFMTMR